MGSLAYLYREEGDLPSAEDWNRLLLEVARRLPLLGKPPAVRAEFNHPFKASVALDPRESNSDGRIWQVRSVLGCVNDTPAAIAYRAKGDPRDWRAPASIDAAKSPVVDRTALEVEDPPFSLVKTPLVGAKGASGDDFQPVPDGARPAYFRTEEMWQKNLWQASVVLTSTPTTLVSPDLPATILSGLPSRYRLTAGKMPAKPSAQAGGLLETARLYLLRDPDAEDAFSDTILVRQFVFWDLAVAYVQPASLLEAYGDAGAYGELSKGEIDELLQAAATVQWWTV